MIRDSYIRLLKHTLHNNAIKIVCNSSNNKFTNSRKQRENDIPGLFIDSNNYKWIYVDNYWCSFNSPYIVSNGKYRRLFHNSYIQKCISDGSTTSIKIAFYGPCTHTGRIRNRESFSSCNIKIEHLMCGGLHLLKELGTNCIQYENLESISFYGLDKLGIMGIGGGVLSSECRNLKYIEVIPRMYDICIISSFLQNTPVKTVKFLGIPSIYSIAKILKNCKYLENIQINVQINSLTLLYDPYDPYAPVFNKIIENNPNVKVTHY